jgi:hypothetical protein
MGPERTIVERFRIHPRERVPVTTREERPAAVEAIA